MKIAVWFCSLSLLSAVLLFAIPRTSLAYDCDVDIDIYTDKDGIEWASLGCSPTNCPAEEGYECVMGRDGLGGSSSALSVPRCDCVRTKPECGTCHFSDVLDPADIASLYTLGADDVYSAEHNRSHAAALEKYRQLIYQDHRERGLIQPKARDALERFIYQIGR